MTVVRQWEYYHRDTTLLTGSNPVFPRLLIVSDPVASHVPYGVRVQLGKQLVHNRVADGEGLNKVCSLRAISWKLSPRYFSQNLARIINS